MKKQIGKYKPDVEFDTFGPYQVGPDSRCLISNGSDFMRLSIPAATSLWIQIGESLGISDARHRRYLTAARPPDPNKPVTDYLRDSGNYDVK